MAADPISETLRRSRRSALLWVLIVAPLLYVLSFGPACWIATRVDDNRVLEVFAVCFKPLSLGVVCLPEWFFPPIERYLGWGAPAASSPEIWRGPDGSGMSWQRPGYSFTVISVPRPAAARWRHR
jgi:hypothetical protein